MNLFFAAVALSAAFSIFLCAEPPEKPAYYLIARDGYVAILDTESGHVERTKTEIALLPPSDAARLAEGIACEDAAALTRVVENYCS